MECEYVMTYVNNGCIVSKTKRKCNPLFFEPEEISRLGINFKFFLTFQVSVIHCEPIDEDV